MTQPQTARHSSLWSLLREALVESHQDFTQGSIRRAILLLSIPMVLEMAMESLFAVVDVFFVARLGAGAITTVGLTEAMLTILFGVAMGLAMATTALVARRTGEKDQDGAARGAVQAVILGLAASVVFGVVGLLFAPDLLALMGAEPSVIREGSTYTRIMLTSSGVILMLFLNNAIFRGAGDATIAMRVLWIANAVNLVLDPCLIFGLGPFPALGVTGAAVATTTGRGIGVLYQLWLLTSGRGRMRIRPEQLSFDLPVIKKIASMAGNAMVQFLIATASWLGAARIVAAFGASASAGYTLAIRVIIFSILPAWGMANAAATLVGQNLGAKQPERAEQSVWRAARYNMYFLGSLSVLLMVFARQIIGVFTAEPDVLQVGTDALRFFSCDYVLFAYGMVIVQAFNGAGDTRTPTILNLLGYWCWQLPLGYVLAVPLGFGPRGVFIGAAIAQATIAVAAIVLFRRGRWKSKQL